MISQVKIENTMTMTVCQYTGNNYNEIISMCNDHPIFDNGNLKSVIIHGKFEDGTDGVCNVGDYMCIMNNHVFIIPNDVFVHRLKKGFYKYALEQEPSWTLASEKLPNDRDWYLGIFKEPDTGWINPIPFICDYVGSETKATTKEYWILRGFTDRDEHIDYYFNLECVKWRPLP